jgi:PilZ domain
MHPIMTQAQDLDTAGAPPSPRTPRRKVYYSAILHIRGLTIRCRIRDLSETGALVETTIPLWSGAPCHVELPKIGAAHGVLVWADGPRSGLHFEPPLLASQLALLSAPVQSARVETHSQDAVRPKTKTAAEEASQNRARNAVSWLRSKQPPR